MCSAPRDQAVRDRQGLCRVLPPLLSPAVPLAPPQVRGGLCRGPHRHRPAVRALPGARRQQVDPRDGHADQGLRGVHHQGAAQPERRPLQGGRPAAPGAALERRHQPQPRRAQGRPPLPVLRVRVPGPVAHRHSQAIRGLQLVALCPPVHWTRSARHHPRHPLNPG